MCVIAIVTEARPSKTMVEKMWNKNQDGAGIAWRDSGKVRWKKGLKLDEITELCKDLPTPYVAHFRLQSAGGLSPALTHPFAIDDFDKSLHTEGETDGSVLFHNGHWTSWRETILQSAINFSVRVPSGKWSDTRGMAWLAGLYGTGFLDLLNEKVVIFGPKTLEVGLGSGWKRVNDVLCSNDLFDIPVTTTTFYPAQHSTMVLCRFGRCTRNVNLDAMGYCPEHSEKNGQVTKALPFPAGSKPVIERLREAEAEEKAYKEGKIKQTDRKYSKNELKRLRRQAEGMRSAS